MIVIDASSRCSTTSGSLCAVSTPSDSHALDGVCLMAIAGVSPIL